MSQPPTPPSPPPPPAGAPATPSTLSWRNWWRNGIACRVAVFLSFVIILNLFQPWVADAQGAGYAVTETHGGTKTRTWFSGVDSKGQANAFDLGMGWTPLLLMLGTLWLCATPKANWGAMRWLPMIAGLIVAGILFFALMDLKREWDEFNSRLFTKAIVTYPAAMQGIFFTGILLAISGAFLARKPKVTGSQ